MKSFVGAVLLFSVSLTFAKPAAPAPTTHPSAIATSQPSGKFPTANELFAKIKKIKQEKQDLPKVAYFDLCEPISEKPMDFIFFAQSKSLTLQTLLDRMQQARTDKDIKAVLISFGQTDFNLAQAHEIRDALQAINRTGKRTFAYADAYDTASYLAATGATDICMLAGGEMMLPGVGLEATFAKGTLDKIGVQADYIQIGKFKGADEEYTRTGPSEELRGELNKLIDSLYSQIIDNISRTRKISTDEVKQIIDDAMLTGETAKKRHLVDHLTDMDGLRELLASQLKEDKVDLVHDYGQDERDDVDLSSPFSLFSMLMRKPEVSDKPAIGLVYADGVIVDGHGGDELFGESGIGSEDIRHAMRLALRDDNIKAIVLRIDSPGGSALASEAMWQSVRRVAKEKPVIVSVGSMAASGGYYLASAGDTIFADPTAIVGSIGVVGGKFVTKDLYGKIGLNTEAFKRGANADLFSSTQPFTDSQRKMVTNWMNETYQMFTQRVLAGRKNKISDIDKVAQGRIFLASSARDLGLVDRIGGIQDALRFAARRSHLKPGTYDIRVIPGPKTLADLITGNTESRTPVPSISFNGLDYLLRSLSPASRKVLAQQLRLIEILAKRPVMLASPYIVTTH
jgi:protease-4